MIVVYPHVDHAQDQTAQAVFLIISMMASLHVHNVLLINILMREQLPHAKIVRLLVSHVCQLTFVPLAQPTISMTVPLLPAMSVPQDHTLMLDHQLYVLNAQQHVPLVVQPVLAQAAK